jgi:hypothetical protein
MMTAFYTPRHRMAQVWGVGTGDAGVLSAGSRSPRVSGTVGV